jgi:beta-mannosidase
MVHASDPLAGEGRWAYRIELMRKQVRELFGKSPNSLDRFALASQICQAEAKKYFVEMTRLGKWRRTGVLWWNVVDGWPQFSDAVVDYYLGKKLAYHYLRRVQQPVCIMIGELADWHHRVVLGNDSRVDVSGRYSIRNAEDGAEILAGEFFGPANENVELGRVPGSHAEHELYLIEWQSNPARGGSAAAIGANHYLAGFPPIDLARYERWLGSIAALSPEFDAEAVAR